VARIARPSGDGVPRVARGRAALCLLLGTSRRLGEIIARHPDLVELLDDKTALTALEPEQLVQGP